MAHSFAFLPQTPTPHRHDHRPTKSSPLAPVSVSYPPSSSPGPVSPVAEVQARRRGQYKSRVPSSSTSSKSKSKFKTTSSTPIPFTLGSLTADAGQAAFLRERFKADCFERARRAREKGVARRRASAMSDASSDGFDIDMSMDEEDDAEDDNNGFDDVLFRRVILNEKRKRAHAYALSYELDVGSFDPSMEDPSVWEEQLRTLPPQFDQDDAPEELEFDVDVPEFDEFDLDEDSAWVDAYIASLPLDSLEAQFTGSSSSHQPHAEAMNNQQMDVMMG